MYKQTETQEEKILFKEIYQPAFRDMNYVDTYEEEINTVDLLVANKYNEYSGTIQFAPFNPSSNKSTLEHPSIFANSEILKDVDIKYIYEVDKIAVMDAERKNGTLDNIVETVYQFTKVNDIRFLVGEMNPLFFRALRINYGLAPIKASKLIRGFDGKSSTQPTILVMENIWRQYEIKKATDVAMKGSLV